MKFDFTDLSTKRQSKMLKSCTTPYLLSLYLICAISQLAIAQNTTFTNAAADNFFNNPANWTDGLPVSGTATIPAGLTCVLNLTSNVTANYNLVVEGTFEINPSSFELTLNQLNLTGQLNNSSKMIIMGATLNGTLTNFSTIKLSGTVLSVGSIINIGEIYNLSGGSWQHNGFLQQVGPSLLENAGLLVNAGTVESFSAVKNTGQVVNNNIFVNGGPFTNLGIFNNNQTLTINNAGLNTGQIVNQFDLTSTFDLTNNGKLTSLGACSFYGIMVNNDTIVNKGDMRFITGSTTFTSSSVCLNEGLLEFYSSFSNAGVLLNNICATMVVHEFSTLTNNNGSITNKGVFYLLNKSDDPSTEQLGVLLDDPEVLPQPTALCVPAIERILNGNKPIDIQPADINAGSFALYCSVTELSVTPSTVDCARSGISSLTLTVTDALGNTSTCQTVLNLIDPEAPQLNCPTGIQVQLDEPGCETVVVFDVTATDNCGVAELGPEIGSPASGDSFETGTTTVIYSATDGQNTVTCSFDVVVQEQLTGLSLPCKDVVSVVLDSNCEKVLTPSDILLTPFGCPASYTISVGSIPNYALVVGGNIGQNLSGVLTYSGQLSCTFAIVVTDSVKPVLNCQDLVVECSHDFSNFPPQSIFDCAGLASYHYNLQSPLNCNNGYVRTYPAIFTATDLSGNTASCSVQIHVQGPQASVIAFPQNIEFSCASTGNTDLNGHPAPSAWQNPETASPGSPTVGGLPIIGYDLGLCALGYTYTDAVSDSSCNGSGAINRIWTLINDCTGETFSSSQLITITDNTAPVVNCPAGTTVPIGSNCLYSGLLPTPTVFDACGNNLSYAVESPSTYVNNFKLLDAPAGVYPVTWLVTDACGNTGSCSFTVTVVDLLPPLSNLPDTIFLDSNNVNSQFFEVYGSDNCSTVSNLIGIAGQPLSQNVTVNLPAGQSTFIVVQYQDAAGNQTLDTVVAVMQGSPAFVLQLVCPNDITINTLQTNTLADISQFGQPVLINTNNLPTTSISEFVINSYNSCQGGTVFRFFSVTETITNTIAQCVQKIFVEPFSDLVVAFPADQTIGSACQQAGNLVLPTLSGNSAPNATITYQDSVSVGPCPTVYRTFIVKENCVYNPFNPNNTPLGLQVAPQVWADNGDGFFKYTQKIELFDALPPVIDAPCVNTQVQVGPDCLGKVSLQVGIFDNCSDSVVCILTSPAVPGGSLIAQAITGTVTYQITLPIGQYPASLIATDDCGNATTCNGLIVVSDSLGLCGQNLGAGYSGKITNISQTPLSGIHLKLLDHNGHAVAQTTTDTKGEFHFDNLNPQTELYLQAEPHHLRLLDIADWITYHESGLYASNTRIADVNRDLTVDQNDERALLNLIAQQQPITSIYLEDADVLTQPPASLYPTLHPVQINHNQHLMLWTPGDMDGSCFNDARNLPQKALTATVPPVQIGKLLAVPVYAEFDAIRALQFGLEWPQNDYKFVALVPGSLDHQGKGMFTTHSNNSFLHIVWAGLPVKTNKDTPLLTLYFNVNTNQTTLSTSSGISPMAYDGQLWEVPIEMQDYSSFTDKPTVYPNPTAGNINVVFNADRAEQVLLEVFDLYGRALYKQTYQSVVGPNRFAITPGQSDTSVFVVRVTLGSEVYSVPVTRQ